MTRFCAGVMRRIFLSAAAYSYFLTIHSHAISTNWSTNSSGLFTTAANWDFGVPDSNDAAIFNRGFVAYEVTFPGGLILDPPVNYVVDQLRVRTNEVSFVYDPRPIFTNPGLTVDGSGISTVVGLEAGDVAIVNMTLSRLSGADAMIGGNPGSNGTLNVSGEFSMSGSINVGNLGTGHLSVTGAGTVTGMTGYVGKGSGSSGSVSVAGANSDWVNSGELFVGNGGDGTLAIESGGSVSNTNGRIGDLAGSTGAVTVIGADSTWTSSNLLTVGNGGSGALRIDAGGHASSAVVLIGVLNTPNNNMVTVTGSGSTLASLGELDVGGAGTGTLSIESGGNVSNTYAYIGNMGSGNGTVTVAGATSTWTNSGELSVGLAGVGTLNVESGSSVSNADGSIGRAAGSNGTVTVTGAGSNWTTSGRLGIGGDAVFNISGGTGTLNIGAAGTVNAKVDVVVFPQGLVRLQGGTLDTPAVSFSGIGGQFQWTSGTLHVGTYNGNLLNQGGTLSPGHSAGNTTIVGSYTQHTAAKLEIEIGGTAAGNTYDVVNATGSANVGGDLQLSFINGFVPSAGNTFTVLSAAGGISGLFNNAPNGRRLVTSGGLGSFVVHYGPSSAFNPNQIRLTDFQPSPTGLVDYEPFDYSPAGADLQGQNGGFGFTGPWTGNGIDPADRFDVAADSLSFGELATAGNRVSTDASVIASGGIARELSVPLGAPGTTSYLSFIVRPEDTLHQGLFNGFFGLYLNASTGDELFVGKPGGGALGEWVLEDLGGAQQHASGVDVVVDEEFLLVIRADFNDGNDVFTLYVNPTPGAAEPLSGTGKNDSDVGTVRSLWLWASGAFSIDELRIGTNYADVVPVSIVLLGDYNQNGTVDAADYTIWRDHLGLTITLDNERPDATTPGVVDQEEYDFWKAHFGEMAGSASGARARATVSEPTTLVLLLFAAAGWSLRRRRAA